MTEQQYRVIADRDKGDDPQDTDWVDGDRVTFIAGGSLVRIERPVPTIECPRCEGRGGLLNTHGEDSDCPRCGGAGSERPSVPTREQIAKALADADGFPLAWRGFLILADAVLALLNGADRRHPDFPMVTSSCTQNLGHRGPHVSIDDYIQWEADRD